MSPELWLLPLALAVAYGIARLVLRHAGRLGLVHAPNSRSSHVRPTPHGGGIGIVLGGFAAMAWAGFAAPGAVPWWPLLASLALAGVGLLDDIRPLPVLPRLLTHGLACVVALWWAGLPWPAFLLLLAAGVWWVNLFNFMDGIDGLAGMQALFMALAAAALSAGFAPEAAGLTLWFWMLALAAACAGFLFLNWPPARIFMGDVGSTWLGFMIFLFCLESVRAGWLSYPAWSILGALFVVDATETLLHRMRGGERWLQAHRSHAYQFLSRHWRGHRPVTLLFLGINALFLAPLAWAALNWPHLGGYLAVAAYAVLFSGVTYLRAWRKRLGDGG